MPIKRKVEYGVNRIKALGAIYREIWRMAKKRKMVLVKPTPEEDRQFEKALTAIEKRYGLSSSEARNIGGDAKRRVERDMPTTVMTLSKVYPTKAEAEEHAKNFRDKIGWDSTIQRTKDGWGVYYQATPPVSKRVSRFYRGRTPRITPKTPRLRR